MSILRGSKGSSEPKHKQLIKCDLKAGAFLVRIFFLKRFKAFLRSEPKTNEKEGEPIYIATAMYHSPTSETDSQVLSLPPLLSISFISSQRIYVELLLANDLLSTSYLESGPNKIDAK